MAIPTRDSLVAQVRADLAAEGVTQVWIRRTLEAGIAVVLGGLLWAWYWWVDQVRKQMNPATATGLGLDAWAAIYGLTRLAARTAAGTCGLTGITGSVQPRGSVIVGPDGQQYTLDADAVMDGTPGEEGAWFGDLTAVAAGDAYNLPLGAALTVVSPAVGMSGTGVVGTTGITGGQNAETDIDLRLRLLDRIRHPGDTGNLADYVRWAKEASASVRRVWPYACGRLGTEPGKVLVLFAITGTNPIPSAGTVTTVRNYIATRRPAGSTVVVQAPTGHATPLTLALDPDFDTTANRALVVGYLREFFATVSPGGTVANLDLRAAAARSGIAIQFRAVDGGAGTADVIPSTNVTLCYLGTVTWGTWA